MGTWVKRNTASFSNRVTLFDIVNPITSSSHTFTYTGSGSNSQAAMTVMAFSGGSSVDIPAGDTIASGAVATLTSDNITTANANELVVSVLGTGGVVSSQSMTAPTGATTGPTEPGSSGASYGVAGGYATVTAAGTTHATWTWTTANNCSLVTQAYIPTGTWALVASIGAPGTATLPTTTSAINTTGATLIVIGVADEPSNGAVGSITDSAGNGGGLHMLPQLGVGGFLGWRAALIGTGAWRAAKAIERNGVICRRRIILPHLGE